MRDFVICCLIFFVLTGEDLELEKDGEGAVDAETDQ